MPKKTPNESIELFRTGSFIEIAHFISHEEDFNPNISFKNERSGQILSYTEIVFRRNPPEPRIIKLIIKHPDYSLPSSHALYWSFQIQNPELINICLNNKDFNPNATFTEDGRKITYFETALEMLEKALESEDAEKILTAKQVVMKFATHPSFSLTTVNFANQNPLHMVASVTSDPEILEALINNKDINACNFFDRSNRTPLHVAALYQNQAALNLLVKHTNVALDALDEQGNSYKDYIKENKHHKVVAGRMLTLAKFSEEFPKPSFSKKEAAPAFKIFGVTKSESRC